MSQYYLHLLLLFKVIHASGVIFFHDRSYIELTPGSGDQKTFGFSLAYQSGIRNLVTGAPHSSPTGKVFNCPLDGVLANKTIKCSEAFIDVDTLAPYNRDYAPNVKLNLGYSVSANDDYFFTCAPLWTGVVQMYENVYKNHTLGTCFSYNGTAHRYNNFVEMFEDKEVVPGRIPGGNGWRTFINKEWLLIAKVSPLEPDVTYARASDALAPVRSIVDEETRGPHAEHLSSFRNVGYSIAVGEFFSSKTIYAISGLDDETNKGSVHFVSANSKNDDLLLLQLKRNRFVEIVDSGPPGSMFGASMCAANLNYDGRSELLVGAPAWGDKEEGSFESGAVHIYLGGRYIFKSTDLSERHRLILGHKNEARFGTAIAATDLDGDYLSEIFISAPYEDKGTGALYILSGYEIYKLLISDDHVKNISMSDFKQTQRIQNNLFKTFGYSLHVIPDIDGNGCNELAVGSPNSTNIMLLRCLPSINVTVTAEHVGQQLKIRDNNFTIQVCINVEDIMNRTSVLSFTLTNEVEGNGVSIETDQTKLNFDVRQENCVDVIVKLDGYEQGDYVFQTRATVDEDKIKNTNDFDLTWALVSPYSKLDDVAEVSRHCEGSDCDPKFTMELNWLGGEITNGSYDLGSSESLTADVAITNIGNSSWDACALVSVSGATVGQFGCIQHKGQYKCLLTKGFKRDQKKHMHIKLNMSRPTNMDEEINVHVVIQDFCDKPKANSTIDGHLKLNLDTKDIIITTGLIRDQSISDIEIQENKRDFKYAHEYWVENNANITWMNMVAKVVVFNKPFINSTKITNEPNGDSEQTVVSYTFNLPPGAKEKFIASADIVKDRIMENLKDNKLTVQSSFFLELHPTSEIINKSISSSIIFKKEKSFENDKNLIILVAIVVGMLGLSIMIFILYKVQFFKSPEKEKLVELKEHVRRQSEAHLRSMSMSDEAIEEVQMEEEDDDAFKES